MCMCINVDYVVVYLQVELCRERSIFHVADIILGEVQIGEVAKATEWRIMHRPYLVLVQPQIHNSAVERSVMTLDVWQKRENNVDKTHFHCKFFYLLMWEGMAS